MPRSSWCSLKQLLRQFQRSELFQGPINHHSNLRSAISLLSIFVCSHFKSLSSQFTVFNWLPEFGSPNSTLQTWRAQSKAFKITTEILKNGGTFIAKVFRGKDTYLLNRQLSCFFDSVLITKPRCSRNSSFEAFIFCRGLQLAGEPNVDAILNEQVDHYFVHMLDEREQTDIPFETATGDLKGLDPDRSYSLSDPLEVSC